ncbi:hypothetical protein [Aurantiacibacter sediminis]|uniref:Uncharacterized protein n=1 Tax=Aurantiacibacter sediminis TaxID=2793064 RepID=A0ABS0N0H9_9SPHN|nr:hypothetical protein [Aurantiacibacter sediminis]MBH5321472.1 hypothetical protein [Aurantiacibacter sediminis]
MAREASIQKQLQDARLAIKRQLQLLSSPADGGGAGDPPDNAKLIAMLKEQLAEIDQLLSQKRW